MCEEQSEENQSNNSVDIKLHVVDGLSMKIYFLDQIFHSLIEIIRLFIFIVFVRVLSTALRKEENIPSEGSGHPSLKEQRWTYVFGDCPGYQHIDIIIN